MTNHFIKLAAQIDIKKDEIKIPQGADTSTALESGLQLFFGIAGGVALIVIILAGFQYVISQGDPQKTAKAKDTILYAIIGLVICIFAFNIVGFVVGRV